MRKMKRRRAFKVGPDDIPVGVWKCVGEVAEELLMGLSNKTWRAGGGQEQGRAELW